MSDKNDLFEANDNHVVSDGDTDDSKLALRRREFLATAAASGFVVATGAIACDAEANGPDKAQTEPPSDQKPPEQPDAAAEQPKEEEKAENMDDKPSEEGGDKVEKVDNKPKTGPGRVVMVTHKGATEKIKKTNDDVVKQMVAAALTKFTGDSDAKTALGRFFKKDDVVGIKINTLGSPYASVHPTTAFTFANLLHELGIPKNKIYIYDQYGSRMRKAGFRPLREKAKDPKDDFPVHFHGTMGYEKEKTDVGGFNKHNKKPYKSQLPKLLKKLTAVLNLCVPKDHDLTGVTGAIKNVSYGNVERVPIYHCKPDCNPTCIHDGKCNVSRIYDHEQMGKKVRLVACDALRVLYQGGPQDNMTYKKAHNAIMVSTDPVAIDRIILEIVNGYRKERKLKTIEEDAGGRRAPRFIAAAEAMGLGVGDLKKIKWEKHELG